MSIPHWYEQSRAQPHSLEVTRSSTTGKYGYVAKFYFDLDQLEKVFLTLTITDIWFVGKYLQPDLTPGLEASIKAQKEKPP